MTKFLNPKSYLLNPKRGFTLIEIMVVVAIIAILVVLAMFMFMNNLGKARDGRRKGDLDRLKIAFEEYYGDENTFPGGDILSECGSGNLKPYLSSVPCDPKTNKPYCYIYDTDNNGQNYRILASLENTSDPIISELNCSGSAYCGFESECTSYGSRFNYGLASSNIFVVSDYVAAGGGSIILPSPSPSLGPLPSTIPGGHACYRQVCNNYGTQENAINSGCPVTWTDDQCNGYCPSSPAYALCIR